MAMVSMQYVQEQSIAYKKTFSNMIEKEWGYLFYNEENPLHYDANHAHLNKSPVQPEVVYNQVLGFFRSRHLPPRYYIYNVEECEAIIEFLLAKGWQFETFKNAIQLWNGKLIELEEIPEIKIEVVDESNYPDALKVECAITEFGGKEVREKAFEFEYKSSAYEHFLLKYKGIPVATACLFIHGKHLQLESVATIKEYRGKGLINHLIFYIQKLTSAKDFENLWVYPINEQVEKIYSRHGFDTVGHYHFGHAFLEGKAIKAIHKGE
ncbi:GNAT superfamily N-acetyltransferase [Bacillus luteolus]|nr:GNAT superfamily N-acetyltransferase [Cytobacillus luteolus]